MSNETANNDKMTKLEKIRFHVNALASLTGIFPPAFEEDAPTEATQGVDHDPLAILRFVENLEGKHEVRDYDVLMQTFQNLGIEVGDIRQDAWAWCGIILRAACVAAGYPDPGEKYNRACNWVDIGVEADPQRSRCI